MFILHVGKTYHDEYVLSNLPLNNYGETCVGQFALEENQSQLRVGPDLKKLLPGLSLPNQGDTTTITVRVAHGR